MTTTYLHIRGTLDEAMVFHARHGYESPRPGSREEGNTEYALLLLDERGIPLVTVHPRVARLGCGQAGDRLQFGVRGTLPLNPEGRSYELRKGDIVIHRQTLRDAPPSPRRPAAKTHDRGVTLRWKSARSVAGTTLTHSVAIDMANGRRYYLGRHIRGDSFEVDLTTLPESGAGTLLLILDDGVRSTSSAVTSVLVPERSPTLHILEPRSEVVASFAQPISLLACCLGMNGRPVSVEKAQWLLDGVSIQASALLAAIDGPAPGRHQLSLSAVTTGGATVEATTSFEVAIPDADFQARKALVDHVVSRGSTVVR